MFRRGGGSGMLCKFLIILFVMSAISAITIIIVIPLVVIKTKSTVLMMGKKVFSFF
jgi:hypothetical protein